MGSGGSPSSVSRIAASRMRAARRCRTTCRRAARRACRSRSLRPTSRAAIQSRSTSCTSTTAGSTAVSRTSSRCARDAARSCWSASRQARRRSTHASSRRSRRSIRRSNRYSWGPSPTGCSTASASRRQLRRRPTLRTRWSPFPPGAAATGSAYRCSRVGFGEMLEGKRIFITGGAGFIATTLARRLVDSNHVIAADNLHRDALTGTPLADHPNFEFHRADVLDGAAIKELARGATHIVHCAAIAGVDTVIESPVRTMRVNVVGTYNALEAALATMDTVERFIDFSTSEVFGTHAFRVTEGDSSSIGSVGEARWTYAVSKLAGEHMARAYHDELHLPATTVHPFNVFGPGQIGGGAIRAFIEAALAGRDLTVHGDGSQIRAWCYVDDMVEALLRCLENAAAVGQAFNVGNPRSAVTIFDLAQRIKRLVGAPGDIVFQPLHYADVELRIPNVEKGRELLGWEPRVELDDGLARTIAWYRTRQPASA